VQAPRQVGEIPDPELDFDFVVHEAKALGRLLGSSRQIKPLFPS
jgi:hypothetical protein